MSLLRVYLFGNPHFQLGNRDLAINRRKASALLAYLCMTGKQDSRDSLATMFWPDYPQSSARANLRRELSRLLQSVKENVLLVERDRIGTNPAAQIWVDALELRSAIGQAQSHCYNQKPVCDRCYQLLKDAVELYAGSFMAGFNLNDCPGFDEWQLYEKTSFQQQMDWALEALVTADIQQHNFPTALLYAKRWLALDNLHEPAHRALIQLYALSGDRSSAMRQYHACQKLLMEELGVQPEVATLELYEEIRSQGSHHPPSVSYGVPAEARELITSKHSKERFSTPRSRLPIYSSPFIGRDKELKAIRTILENPDCRLLTLSGLGGAGKTRLAIKIAQETSALFSNGVFFIPLASLNSSRGVLASLVDEFGLGSIDEKSSPMEAITSFLENKTTLLVFDNFEHLVDSANLLSEIITQTEGVKILATSRQRLNLQHEWVFEIEGLAYPLLPDGKDLLKDGQPDEIFRVEQFSAVALFLATAQRVKVGFTPSPSDQVLAARIAASVGGMPLALELAAGWVGLLSINEIHAEIERNLDILETTSVDVPGRQRSLRSVFEHSWELLSEREKEVFPGLAVFRGGFTRQAAQEVLRISLRELAGLANKSLLVSKPDGRFELHELLRQYAYEKLIEKPEWQRSAERQHCVYFCTYLERRLSNMKSSGQLQTLVEIDAELSNIISAWDWAVNKGELEWIGRALEPLCLYYWKKGRVTDGFDTCRFALERLDQLSAKDPLLAGRLFAWKGKFSSTLGDMAAAEVDYKRSLQAVRDSGKSDDQTRLVRARAFQGLGNLANFSGEAEPVIEYYKESLSLYMADGELSWAADLLIEMAVNLIEMHNNYEEGMKCLNESREIRKRSGDPFGPANLLVELGITNLFELGKTEEALRHFEEARQIYSAYDSLSSQAEVLECSMYLAYAQGDYLAAREWGEQLLSVTEELGIRRFLLITLGMITECDNGLGDYVHAEQQIRRAVGLLQAYGELDIQMNMYSWALACILLAKGEWGGAKSILESCVQASQQKLGKHTLARNLAVLSRTQIALGEIENAWDNAKEALELFLTYPHLHWYLYGLATAAYLMADMGELQRAVEAYACVVASPLATYSRWFEDVYGREIRNMASRLPAGIYEAAWQRGILADPWQIGRGLLADFFQN